MMKDKNINKASDRSKIRSQLLLQLQGATFLVLLGAILCLMYLTLGDHFPSWNTTTTNLNPNKRIILPDKAPPVYLENNIDLVSGLHFGKGFKTVRAVCTACHSAKLITQNRATYQGWKDMILWMQETQGLQDLGPQEKEILEYLSTYYAPKEVGRRQALEVKDWYYLED